MGSSIWLYLICVPLLSTAVTQGAGDAELNKLQGTWKMVYSECEGEGFKPTNDVRITFDKNTYIGKHAGEVATRCTFKIDPKKNPKHIDLTIIENKLIPESKGTKVHCIYEIREGRLTIVSPPPGFPTWRPKKMATKEGTGVSLDTYEKVKE